MAEVLTVRVVAQVAEIFAEIFRVAVATEAKLDLAKMLAGRSRKWHMFAGIIAHRL